MPRYDYQCTSCDQEFELRQSFSEAGSGTCPVCAGLGRRVYHAVPVIYKGSGFYTTDYGRPKPPPEEKEKATDSDKTTSDSSKKASSDSSSSSSSDSKSDSTSKSTSETTA